MKKVLTTTILSLAVASAFSQINWQKGGNNAFPPGSQPTLGTNYNAPLGFVTNGINRMKLNGSFPPAQYFVNGYGGGIGPNTINTSGCLLLGPNSTAPGSNFYNTSGAFSQLHITGINSVLGVPQAQGFRPWMKAGISITDNDDFHYIGSHKVGDDVSELALVFGNNPFPGGNVGPDVLSMRFSTGAGTQWVI